MIITDLDKTLLNNQKEITEYTKNVFQKVKNMDIKIVFATARPLRNTRELFCSIKPDALICHCGAIGYIDDKPIFENGIETNVAKDIINDILKKYPKINYGLEVEDIFYTNFDTKVYWDNVPYENISKKQFLENTTYKIIIGLEYFDNIIDLEKYLKKNLYLETMDGKIALIMNKKATKWNGIKKLMKYYNLIKEDLLAFGDDYSDIEMIENCGIGVAMENGIKEIKNKAKYICGNNEEDGVAKWIDSKIIKKSQNGI